MKINIDRLRRLAESATPGPWKATHEKLRPQYSLKIMEVVGAPGEPAVLPWKAFDSADRTKAERLANSRYIAAANPAAVLELLNRIDCMAAALESARSCITEDRQTLFDCHKNPITGLVDDELGAEALATYDRHLKAINTALHPPKVRDQK